MNLTKEQINQVLSRLEEIHDQPGHFDIDIELDGGISVHMYGDIEIGGRTDFSDGTFTETWRDARIDIFKVFGEDGDELDIDFDTYNFFDNYLNETLN